MERKSLDINCDSLETQDNPYPWGVSPITGPHLESAVDPVVLFSSQKQGDPDADGNTYANSSKILDLKSDAGNEQQGNKVSSDLDTTVVSLESKVKENITKVRSSGSQMSTVGKEKKINAVTTSADVDKKCSHKERQSFQSYKTSVKGEQCVSRTPFTALSTTEKKVAREEKNMDELEEKKAKRQEDQRKKEEEKKKEEMENREETKQSKAETEKKKEEYKKMKEEKLKKEREQEETKKKEEQLKEAVKREEERKGMEEAVRRKKKEEEAARREEEKARRKKEEEVARRKKEEEAARRKEEEAKRKKEEEELARRKEEEAKRKKEEEQLARRKKEEEELARRKEEEAKRKKEEEEAARRKKEEEELARRKKEEEEAARRKKEEEELARRKKEEELARRKKEEEEAARRKKEEEELARRKKEEEEAARRKKEEEEAARRKKEEEEAVRRKKEEEEAVRRREEMEIRRKEAVATKEKVEDAAKRKVEEEAVVKKKEEVRTGESTAAKKNEDEAARRKKEGETKKIAEQVAKEKSEKSQQKETNKKAKETKMNRAEKAETTVTDEEETKKRKDEDLAVEKEREASKKELDAIVKRKGESGEEEEPLNLQIREAQSVKGEVLVGVECRLEANEEEKLNGTCDNSRHSKTIDVPESSEPKEEILSSTPPIIDYVTLEDAPRMERPQPGANSMEEDNLDPKFTEAQLMSSGNEKKEHLYKILVIGELGTGKTSIIKRYVHQFFSQHYRATIGVDFALKVISWDADTLIRLQLWDIAGQERFGNMTRVYYKEAVGAFVVFDVTRVPTFEAVVKWKNDLDSKVQLSDGSHIPCVLLANKCDQTKEGLVNNSEQMEEFCKEKGFLGWFETSAKENINIDEAARFLVSQILKNDQSMNSGEEGDKDKIMLDKDNHQEASPKKSCCR